MPVKVTESSANIYTKISKIYFQPYAHTTLIFDDYTIVIVPFTNACTVKPVYDGLYIYIEQSRHIL